MYIYMSFVSFSYLCACLNRFIHGYYYYSISHSPISPRTAKYQDPPGAAGCASKSGAGRILVPKQSVSNRGALAVTIGIEQRVCN